MSPSWGWLGPYISVIILAVLLAPYLATLPLFHQTFIGPLGIPASVAVQLAADGISLLMIWLTASRASRQLTNNGKGQAFLRAVLFPLTLFLLILLGHRLYLMHGVPVFGPLKRPQYDWWLTGGLVGAASWLTVAWVRHLYALMRVFHIPERRRGIRSSDSGTYEREAVLSPEGEEKTFALKTGNGSPTSLGRYKIIRELGRGAMGIVYLGKDPTILRLVAIKTMRLDDIEDRDELKEFKERFFREVESTGRLSHPNIVTIYDAGEQDGLGYIAMEYLEGTALSAYCQPGKLLPVKQVLGLVATVADALDYAHTQDIVHRDIKPANIMLTRELKAKVMDFGIAKVSSATKTHTKMILGTPSYLSPEQAGGKIVDGRSDIFSLGVVLFELLAGRKPFEAPLMPALIYKITNERHPPLSKFRPDLPSAALAAIQMIIDRALEKDWAKRHRRAGDMAKQLRSCFERLYG